MEFPTLQAPAQPRNRPNSETVRQQKKVQSALLMGVGLGGREENRPKTLFFFSGKHHDNQILKVHILLSRNFVVIAQAPAPTNFECPQMWVWPQVPLEGPPLPPSLPPPHPRTPPPTPDWAAPSRNIAKRAKGGWGEEGGRGRGGKGFGLREGPSNCNGGWGGTLPTPVGARPASGGSQPRGSSNQCLFL